MYNEIQSLVLNLNIEIIIKEIIKIKQKNPSTFLGKGNLLRLKDIIIKYKIDLLIINNNLSPSQQRNLEKLLNIKVTDRSGIIIEIFSKRASTKESRLQVELAELIYRKSRLVRAWTHLERQRGGTTFIGGPGELQIELDKRLIQSKIVKIKKRLVKVRARRKIQRKSRLNSNFQTFALVGYTNAGKTTLFNKLTESNQKAENQLFATLDSVTRKNKNPIHGPVLFSDTVGFISELPTQLIESFKATLDELKSADMLLHVVDISDQDYKAKIDQVNIILEDLGVTEIPTLIVNNKCDAINLYNLKELKKKKNDEIFISAENDKNFSELRLQIYKQLFNGFYDGWVSMENGLAKERSILFDMGCVQEERVSNCGKIFANIKISNKELDKFINLKGFELCHDEDILLA